MNNSDNTSKTSGVKRFQEYISELKNPKKSLWIFDFDDTLAIDMATIDVVDKTTGKVLKSLDSEGFKHYTLKDNERFDFESFVKNDVKGQPIPATLAIMRKVIGRGGRAVILTGRSSGIGAKKYLSDMGINVEVIAVGKKAAGGSHKEIAMAKKQWISDQIDMGYNDIEVFDDNALNIKYIESLRDRGNVRIKTKLVKYRPK